MHDSGIPCMYDEFKISSTSSEVMLRSHTNLLMASHVSATTSSSFVDTFANTHSGAGTGDNAELLQHRSF